MLTIVIDIKPERISTHLHTAMGYISFDSSYTTGGQDITTIFAQFSNCKYIDLASKLGYSFEAVLATKKVKVYTAANVEVLNAVNLTALSEVRFIAVGLG